MLGFKLVRASKLAALQDADTLLRSTGYFVDVRPDGLLEKGYQTYDHTDTPSGTVRRKRQVDLVYPPGKGPWGLPVEARYEVIDE